jgi:hypothetical protein
VLLEEIAVIAWSGPGAPTPSRTMTAPSWRRVRLPSRGSGHSCQLETLYHD